MASWSTYKFGSSRELTEFLNGAIINSLNLHSGADVDGKTFIFEVNGGGDTTVTFTPAKSRNWTLEEIVAHINLSEAGLAEIRTETRPGFNKSVRKIKLEKDLTSFEVKATGTANGVLGFVAVAADYVPDTEVPGGPKAVPGEQDTWLIVRYA